MTQVRHGFQIAARGWADDDPDELDPPDPGGPPEATRRWSALEEYARLRDEELAAVATRSLDALGVQEPRDDQAATLRRWSRG